MGGRGGGKEAERRELFRPVQIAHRATLLNSKHG